MKPRSLYAPRPASVRMGSDGVPLIVDSIPVAAVREEWLVEDRWWNGHPLCRRYFELVLEDGRDVVVFSEQASGRWFAQRS